MSNIKVASFSIGFHAGFMKKTKGITSFEPYKGSLGHKFSQAVSMKQALRYLKSLENNRKDKLYTNEVPDTRGVAKVIAKFKYASLSAKDAKEILKGEAAIDNIHKLSDAEVEVIGQYTKNIPTLDNIFKDGTTKGDYVLIKKDNSNLLYNVDSLSELNEEGLYQPAGHIFADMYNFSTGSLKEKVGELSTDSTSSNIARLTFTVDEIEETDYEKYLEEDQKRRGLLHLKSALKSVDEETLEVLKKYNPALSI